MSTIPYLHVKLGGKCQAEYQTKGKMNQMLAHNPELRPMEACSQLLVRVLIIFQQPEQVPYLHPNSL
jgi:hypothetical protein